MQKNKNCLIVAQTFPFERFKKKGPNIFFISTLTFEKVRWSLDIRVKLINLKATTTTLKVSFYSSWDYVLLDAVWTSAASARKNKENEDDENENEKNGTIKRIFLFTSTCYVLISKSPFSGFFNSFRSFHSSGRRHCCEVMHSNQSRLIVLKGFIRKDASLNYFMLQHYVLVVPKPDAFVPTQILIQLDDFYFLKKSNLFAIVFV